MGLGGISPWSLVIILVIVVLLFGTKKLRNMGGDLGGALKNFKKAMAEDDADKLNKDESKEDDKENTASKESSQDDTKDANKEEKTK